jgi:hypothetical protein
VEEVPLKTGLSEYIIIYNNEFVWVGGSEPQKLVEPDFLDSSTPAAKAHSAHIKANNRWLSSVTV